MDIDFGMYPDILRSKYLDVYAGIHVEMVYTNKFRPKYNICRADKNDKRHKDQCRRKISYYRSRVCLRKIVGGTECQILLDMGATKSYMSKSYYLQCKTLHALPRFSSNTQRIQVGNGQYVSVLYVIAVIIEIHGHRFKIFTLVSEVHDNVDLVMGMKNIFELEGMIDSRDSCFSFLSRLIPFSR